MDSHGLVRPDCRGPNDILTVGLCCFGTRLVIQAKQMASVLPKEHSSYKAIYATTLNQNERVNATVKMGKQCHAFLSAAQVSAKMEEVGMYEDA